MGSGSTERPVKTAEITSATTKAPTSTCHFGNPTERPGDEEALGGALGEACASLCLPCQLLCSQRCLRDTGEAGDGG